MGRSEAAASATEEHQLEGLVRRWSQYVPISDDDRQALFDLPLTYRPFGKDSYLVREGQKAVDCTLLLRGFAFRHKVVRNGSRQIISIHIPTEFVDLQNGLLEIADHNVQCLSPCEVAVIPRAALMGLAADRTAIRLAMWIDTLIDSSVFREWVVNVGRRDSRTRIAHLLCELALRLDRIGANQEGTFEFPLTQEQLADATGLTPVHTNRTLQMLRRDGLILLTARSLTVLDWDRLRSVGDFDELYLHHQAPAPEKLENISS
jgi:CRP-like cAMP-binding protein